jgi:hypothetical protein
MQSIGTASSRSWNTPVRVPALVSATAKVISNCHWSPKQLRAISLSLDICFFIQSTCVCVCVWNLLRFSRLSAHPSMANAVPIKLVTSQASTSAAFACLAVRLPFKCGQFPPVKMTGHKLEWRNKEKTAISSRNDGESRMIICRSDDVGQCLVGCQRWLPASYYQDEQ